MIFHEILSKVPTPPSRLNADVPPDLERLILKALEKDRDIRYQSAAEMRVDLKRMKRDHDSSRSASVVPTPATSGSGRRWRSEAQVAAVVIAVALAAAVYLGWSRRAERGKFPGRSLNLPRSHN